MVDDVYAMRLTVPDLEAGMQAFRAGWKYQRWPVFAELAEFFTRALPAPVDRASAVLSGEAWADQIMRTHWGPEAADRGVAWGLWLWLDRHPGEHPDGAVLDRLVREQAQAEESAATIPEADPLNLRGLWEGLCKRERQMAAKYGSPLIEDQREAV